MTHTLAAIDTPATNASPFTERRCGAGGEQVLQLRANFPVVRVCVTSSSGRGVSSRGGGSGGSSGSGQQQ